MAEWTINNARQRYAIAHWGAGYFDVDETGRVIARPRGGQGATVALAEIVERAEALGLRLPLLVRFTDMLAGRTQALCEAFDAALEKHGYAGKHCAVYPIKVNQQRSVVAHILNSAGDRVGLEAGSKPELIAALGLSDDNGVIVCNGYKDTGYIRLALAGQQTGKRVFLVVEKLNELSLVLTQARTMNVRPRLGVRLRLASLGKGNWQNTGGEKAKFGLSAAQLLEAATLLNKQGLSDCLELVHFHMGSQISNLRDIEAGAREAARCYVELRKLGFEPGYLDVGGGLGVDYEGSRSRSFCSMNYGLDAYADAIVESVGEVCRAAGLSAPTLITESGRAMTAHHAVLITNVSSVQSAALPTPVDEPDANAAQIIKKLWRIHSLLGDKPAIECYHDADEYFQQGLTAFMDGSLNLAERAALENLYQTICLNVRERLDGNNRVHREALDALNARFADKLYCNFSVFQSVPDVWAIEQIFPIVPLERLDERPGQRGVIEDLTCDSDGRIDLYVDQNGVTESMPVHAISGDERYLLGIFLVGAYQETLGDIHNLFGAPYTVDVHLAGENVVLTNAGRGDTIGTVLEAVGYDVDILRRTLVAQGLDGAMLEAALDASTYLSE